MDNTLRLAFLLPLLTLGLVACSTAESHRTVEKETVKSYGTTYSGPKHALSIGKFDNASPYMRGIFSEGPDRLGEQSKTILKTHLSQTGRFNLLDRDNLDETAAESRMAGTEQQLTGAEFVVTGQVTEFGRRTTDDRQLFGLAGRGKKQIAYSVVSINVVDVKTGQVVFSVQGAGEYQLDDHEVIGFGTSSGYDSTLNGKVLNQSIATAVDNLVDGLEKGAWGPAAKK